MLTRFHTFWNVFYFGNVGKKGRQKKGLVSKRRRFIIGKKERLIWHIKVEKYLPSCWNLREDFFLNNCIIHPSSLPHTKSCNKKKLECNNLF